MSRLIKKIIRMIKRRGGTWGNVPLSILLVSIVGLLGMAGAASAAPSITSWSSTGGTTTNKDNEQDIMYLAQQGDSITFNITVTGATSYKWFVNKVDQSNNADTFTWTVPSKKDIWEIRVEASDETVTVPKEWVISTLSLSEAPDVFDSFADGKLNGARADLDPWGRVLPLWTVESGGMNASERYAVETALGLGNHANFSTPTDIIKGTWIFKYKYINGTPNFVGGNYMLEMTAQYNNPAGMKPGYDSVYKGLSLKNPVDGHWWIDFDNNRKIYRNGYIVNMAGSQIDKTLVGGNSWHEVVFIKDQNDYIYTWLDGKFVRWTTDKVYDITDSIKFFIDFYDGLYSLAYPIAVDDIRIYRDQYLPPLNSIAYNPASGSITIKGFGATLDKIAAAINDPAIFSYDPSTNTAVSYKNITVDRGSELKIENGKLLMASNYDGERKINYYTDAIFNIYNSTIASTNNYYYLFQRLSDGDANLKGIFKIINSTLDNFGAWSLERPVTLWIENSKFTNLAGNFTVYFRWPPRELKIKNSKFSGKTGMEKVRFYGGDQFAELVPKPVGIDITDSDFSQVTLECERDSTYYLSPGTPGGTANIINTKPGNYSGYVFRLKYYLDVKVIDAYGNPVQWANISVVNEKDDVNYPAENLLQGKKYFQLQNQLAPDGSPYFSGQTSNWLKGWADINDYRTTTTDVTGHTPLPSDDAHTLVITDYIQDSSGTTDFTYTVKAEKDGLTNELSGINPDETWYRPDPNLPTKTITIQLPIADISAIDINQDGTIDISDLRIVALHFGEITSPPYPRYDVNTDGTVDILDLRQVAGGM